MPRRRSKRRVSVAVRRLSEEKGQGLKGRRRHRRTRGPNVPPVIAPPTRPETEADGRSAVHAGSNANGTADGWTGRTAGQAGRTSKIRATVKAGGGSQAGDSGAAGGRRLRRMRSRQNRVKSVRAPSASQPPVQDRPSGASETENPVSLRKDEQTAGLDLPARRPYPQSQVQRAEEPKAGRTIYQTRRTRLTAG